MLTNLHLPIQFIDKTFTIKQTVEVFPQQGGWHYVRAPKKITDQLKFLTDRGLIAITARIGKYSWKTSLLPYGDGTHFIALPAKVRNAEHIHVGDLVSISFQLRER